MTIKLFGSRPYNTTSHAPGMFTWDGTNLTSLGTQPDWSSTLTETCRVADQCKSGASSIWFDGVLYALVGEYIWKSIDGISWAKDAEIGNYVLQLVSYSAGTGDTITITTDLGTTVLTEGVDFDSVTQNTTAALNIKNAIDAIAGVSATVNSTTVYVSPDAPHTLTAFTTNGGTSAWTITNTGDLDTYQYSNITIWQGGFFTANTAIVGDSTVAPRLFLITADNSGDDQYQIWTKSLSGTSWSCYEQAADVGDATVWGGSTVTSNAARTAAGPPSMRVIENKLWIGGMWSSSVEHIFVWDIATKTSEFFYANANTVSDADNWGNAQPIWWKGGVYWMSLHSTTTLALYKYAAGGATKIVDLGTVYYTSSGYDRCAFDEPNFIDPATNDLICIWLSGHKDSAGSYKASRIANANDAATDITSAVLPSELTDARARRDDRWSFWIDAESVTTAEDGSRTPSINFLYRPCDHGTSYATAEMPIQVITWVDVSTTMTISGSTAGAAWFTEQATTEGTRTYGVDQCMPIITSVTPGVNKMTIKAKLYLTNSTTTTAWKVSLYYRRATEAYAKTRGTLTGTLSQTGITTPTMSGNVISVVTAATKANGPEELTFEWDISGGAPADGEKVAIVLFAHQ